MRYRLFREQQLNCDIETAWEFFSCPNNLSKITPKDMRFTVMTDCKNEEIFEGMIINYTVSPFLKVPLMWKPINALLIFRKKDLINTGIIFTNLFLIKTEC